MNDVPGPVTILQFLEWWTPGRLVGADAGGMPMHRIRSMFLGFNSALMTASARQSTALTELNADLLTLVRRATQVTDKQALDRVEFQIYDRIRRCTKECYEGWAGVAAAYSTTPAEPANAETAGHADASADGEVSTSTLVDAEGADATGS